MSNNINNEDMNIIKFKSLINKLISITGKVPIRPNTYNPFKIIFNDNKEKNKYVEIVMDSVFWIDYPRIYKDITMNITTIGADGMKSIINNCKSIQGRKNAIRIIFYSLLIVAIDNRYREKINLIADMAYLMKMSEQLLQDCVKAVEAVVDGKDIRNIEYLTSEARNVFCEV